MKLYTRSEIIKMLDFFQVNDADIIQFIDTLKPIELPTDEEIEIKSSHIGILSSQKAFIGGAKWMRDKIQGGNK